MTFRKPEEMIAAQPASDGDGVKLKRVFGGHRPQRFDPFLMMDEFGSNEASDYIGGFPPHPHRGFETITYMLRGKMEHRDHMDNVGLLNDGDVQWMTAARGIIHSEMPRQTEGQMRGFQLWLNLPATEKMSPARYGDVPGEKLPRFRDEAYELIAIAGTGQINGQEVAGYFERPATQPLIWDLHLEAGARVALDLGDERRAMVYAYDGEVSVGDTALRPQHLLRLSDKGVIALANTGEQQARILVLAGKPLGEPIAQYGPFVMNTPAEIEQALDDYRNGRLTA